MSKLSGIKDLDREILGKIDDRELLKVCSIDKYTWNTVCDDAFLRRRLLAKYPEIEQYKFENETWKNFFLRVVQTIALMKKQFGYVYTFGNFDKQYEILVKYKKFNAVLLESAIKGELALVIWELKNGFDIHYGDDLALRLASDNNHLKVVKYLVESGANIHAENDYALRFASRDGNLEVVKYLLEHGANIHAKDDYALRMASEKGHLEVVKCLIEHGANIYSNYDYALRWASRNGHLDVVNYLESKI